MQKKEDINKYRTLTSHLVQGSRESTVLLFQSNKSCRAFDLLTIVGLHNKQKREINFEPVPNYSSCTQPRGLLPSGALVALPIVKNQRKKRRKLTWLNRESGVDAEAVRSTKGTGVVRSTDGAAVAAALVPAMSAAAPAPGKGYFD